MSNYKEKLFSEFPPVSTEEWMAKITEDLKGADFEKKLVWRTNEGFKVQPFYRAPKPATPGTYVRASARKTSRRLTQRPWTS